MFSKICFLSILSCVVNINPSVLYLSGTLEDVINIRFFIVIPVKLKNMEGNDHMLGTYIDALSAAIRYCEIYVAVLDISATGTKPDIFLFLKLYKPDVFKAKHLAIISFLCQAKCCPIV